MIRGRREGGAAARRRARGRRAFMVKMKEAASDAAYAWLHTSSLSAESEGVRSSSAGCTPCGKQNAAASGVTGLPGGNANSTWPAQRRSAAGVRRSAAACSACAAYPVLWLQACSCAWCLGVQQGAWGMQQKRDAAAAHVRVVHAAEKWFGPPCLNRTWGGRGCPRGAPRCSRSFAASAVTATLRISPERAARARAQPDL